MDNNRREKESKNNPQHTKRGHKAKPLRPFFAYSPQGKKKRQTQIKKDNNKRQPEQSRQGKGQKQVKRWKGRQRRGKTDKTKANTPQVFKPPNYSRVQKPHKPRKARKPHKPTRNPIKPAKTPQKREIGPYLQATHQGKSERADKSNGIHDQRTRASIQAGPEASKAYTNRHTKEPVQPTHSAPTFQKYV